MNSKYSPEALSLLNAIAERIDAPSTDAGRNQCISVALCLLTKEGGLDVSAAWELIFGAGTWETLAGEIYDTLRAQASA